MILEKLIVGALGTNCYIFGSEQPNKVIIIDPGAEAKTIYEKIEQLSAEPIAVIMTHGHFDHSQKVGRILKHYDIPLKYNKKEYDSGIYSRREADEWLKEGDTVKVGGYTLHVLETPGHSPGSISLYTKDVKQVNGEAVDGILFTGDLLFRRSIGRSDFEGGNQSLLFKSIREKIMNNPDITDDFKVYPGHMGNTSVGAERQHNMFKEYFQ